MSRLLINAVLFQATYLACVLGAAAGYAWLGLLPLAVLALHVAQAPQPGDARLTIAALLAGMLLGWFWQYAGLLVYASNAPLAGQAPVWILCLWAGFALTLNHSLRWLTSHLGMAALFGAIGSPLSYWTASRFGAAEFLVPTWQFLLANGLVWGLLVPALAWLARFLRNRQPQTAGVAP